MRKRWPKLLQSWTRWWRIRSRRQAFTIALVGLAGKLAAADGHIDPEERESFRRMLKAKPFEWKRISQQFDLVAGSQAGAEIYAEMLSRLTQKQPERRRDILLGLVDIAYADGEFSDQEREFIARAAFGLGLNASDVALALGQNDEGVVGPWGVLGLNGPVSCRELKQKYHDLAREFHPDAALARGAPEELVEGFSRRFQRIHEAYKLVYSQCCP